MESIAVYEQDGKFIELLNRVLLLIERLWGRSINDPPMRKWLADVHRALGELRDALELHQSARVA